MRRICARFTRWKWFERGIIFIIILNAAVLGIETYPSMFDRYGSIMQGFNQFVLVVFVVEAILKIIAVSPRIDRYFCDGWNFFDFSIVVLSLIPQTGEYALITRTIRLLRVFRLITTMPELRLIVTTLLRSLPGLGNVVMLLAIIFYIYAITGFYLFHEHDPFHWSSLGISLITLFRVLTLEDWTDVMYTAMELYPMAWLYFVSFVFIAAFIVINMVIAVVLNNLSKSQQEIDIGDYEDIEGEILHELRTARKTLQHIEEYLDTKHGKNSIKNE